MYWIITRNSKVRSHETISDCPVFLNRIMIDCVHQKYLEMISSFFFTKPDTVM